LRFRFIILGSFIVLATFLFQKYNVVYAESFDNDEKTISDLDQNKNQIK
jgi:hypothetical protein